MVWSETVHQQEAAFECRRPNRQGLRVGLGGVPPPRAVGVGKLDEDQPRVGRERALERDGIGGVGDERAAMRANGGIRQP